MTPPERNLLRGTVETLGPIAANGRLPQDSPGIYQPPRIFDHRSRLLLSVSALTFVSCFEFPPVRLAETFFLFFPLILSN